jgi:hypothetical protein
VSNHANRTQLLSNWIQLILLAAMLNQSLRHRRMWRLSDPPFCPSIVSSRGFGGGFGGRRSTTAVLAVCRPAGTKQTTNLENEVTICLSMENAAGVSTNKDQSWTDIRRAGRRQPLLLNCALTRTIFCAFSMSNTSANDRRAFRMWSHYNLIDFALVQFKTYQNSTRVRGGLGNLRRVL